MIRAFLAGLAGVGAALAGTPARAAELDFLILHDNGAATLYVRSDQDAAVTIEQSDDMLVLRFDQALQGDLAAPVARAPDLFLSAHHPDETWTLLYRLPAGARIAHAASERLFAVAIADRPVTPDLSARKAQALRAAFFFRDRAVRPKYRAPTAAPKGPAPASSPMVLAPAPDGDDPGAAIALALGAPSLLERPAARPTAAAPLSATSPDRWRARSGAEGFERVEETLLAESAREPASPRNRPARDLAAFYLAHDLSPEALAILAAHDPHGVDPAFRVAAARANLNIARLADALREASAAIVADDPVAAALRFQANVALGRFDAAARDAARARSQFAPGDAAMRAALFSFYLETDQFEAASDHLARIAPHMRGAERARFDAWRGALSIRRGRGEEGARLLRVARAGAGEPLRAEIDLLLLRQGLASGAVDAGRALEETRSLDLRWRAPGFTRALLEFASRAADAAGDQSAAIAARRRLIAHHDASDAAERAARAITTRLPGLFADPSLSPMEAARLFYQNVEFAPPGAAGDAVIADAIEALISLDLLSEAIELADHQTFARFRAARRAESGARLAALHLQTNDPARAIDALRRSAFSRLAPDLREWRISLEARAHHARGDDDAARALLADIEGDRAAWIEGEIAWRAGRYRAAGEAFARGLASDDPIPNGPAPRDLALRAGAAFALSQAPERIDAVIARMEDGGDGATSALLRQLRDGVDAAAPDRFWEPYRAAFNTPR